MIDALIADRLLGREQRRTSKNGNGHVTATVCAPMGIGETAFLNVIAAEAAVTALLARDEGDSIALAGELKVSAEAVKTGHAALTEYHITRKRTAAKDEAV